MSAPADRVLRMLATSGTVAVIICQLCGSLVVADGERQHDLAHRASLLGGTDEDGSEAYSAP